jgi:excisionase family DNA binding protein
LALLTVAQAAQELGIKPKTLRDWLAKRRITYVKLGYIVRIDSAEIQRLITRSIVPALPDRAARKVTKPVRRQK